MGKLLGKKPETTKGKPTEPVQPGAGILAAVPGIWEYLTLDHWEGGHKRQTSTLSVFVDDGTIKVSLNDRALSRSAFAAGESLESCLKALEEALQGESAEWRGWRSRK